jgi:ABC-type arginine transport system ATPase subunit
VLPRATFQRGRAAEEAELFPSHRADSQGPEGALAAPLELDPAVAWIESARAVDPDLSITLELIRRLRGTAGQAC